MATTAYGTHVYDQRVGATVYVPAGTDSATLPGHMLRRMTTPALWGGTAPDGAVPVVAAPGGSAVVSDDVRRIDVLTTAEHIALPVKDAATLYVIPKVTP